jgi:hypothetical protein
MTNYLDFGRLEAIDPVAFRGTKPFPHANPEGLLTDEGYAQLLANMPDLSLFEKVFGYRRLGGQEPHDRYALEYTSDAPVPEPWREFIAELRSDRYRDALTRLLSARSIELRFHWHYTPSGCSVSPHTDSEREHGSHLFYFNGEGDWDPDWGGNTLVLDDGGRLDFESAPAIEDFDNPTPAEIIGNRGLIFQRTDHSWHAVRAINCPADRMRRLFKVVASPRNPIRKLRNRIIGKEAEFF